MNLSRIATKRLIIIISSVLLLIAFLVFGYYKLFYQASRQVEIPRINYYVSDSIGNDNNDGKSSTTPFKTIEKAHDVVAAFLSTYSRTEAMELYVNILGGTYHPTRTIELSSVDSKDNIKVIYKKYYTSQPVIIRGSVDLAESWTVQSGGTPGVFLNNPGDRGVLNDFKIGEIYLDGSRQVLAQEPEYVAPILPTDPLTTTDPYNTGTDNWFFTSDANKTCAAGITAADGTFVPTVVTQADKTELQYIPANIEGDSGELANNIYISLSTQPDSNKPQVDIYPRTDWSQYERDIVNIDTISHKIILSAPIGNSTDYLYICPKNRYAVKNFLGALDSAGEWYRDMTTGLIYFKPPGGSIGGRRVSVPVLKKAFSFDPTAKNIMIDGLTFEEFGDDAVINVDQSSSISIVNSTIRSSAGYGIKVSGTSQKVANNIKIDRNNIYNLGRTGISVSPSNNVRKKLYANNERTNPIDDNIIISNNTVHDVAYQDSDEVGIFVNFALKAKISHNEVYNLPRIGIRVQSNDSIIDYNRVHDTMLLTQDGAAIYVYGRFNFRGNTINNNLVENSHGYGKYNFGLNNGDFKINFGALGIYFDLSAGENYITNNIVVNATRACLDNNGGSYNTFTNNFCVSSGTDGRNGTQVLMSENADVFESWRTQLLAAYSGPDNIIGTADDVLDKLDYEKMYPKLTSMLVQNPSKTTGEYMIYNTFQKNIYYYPAVGRTMSYISTGLGTNQIIRQNLLWPTGAPTISRKFNDSEMTTWDQWKNLGFDVNSNINRDPKFKKYYPTCMSGGQDYTLCSDSPALQSGLGISQIDQTQFGPL